MKINRNLGLIGLISAISLITVNCGKVVNSNKKPTTQLDTASYFIGYQLGKQFKSQGGLTELDYGTFIRGFEEAMKKDSGFAINMDDPQISMKFQRIVMSLAEKNNKKAAEKFKTKNEEAKAAFLKQNSGASSKPNGTVVYIANAGTGADLGVFDTMDVKISAKDMSGKPIKELSNLPTKMTIMDLQQFFPELADALSGQKVGCKLRIYLDHSKIAAFKQFPTPELKFGSSVLDVDVRNSVAGKAPKEPEIKMPDMQPKQ